MALRHVVGLLHKLLELCRRGKRCALQWLLKLFSVLNRYMRMKNPGGSKSLQADLPSVDGAESRAGNNFEDMHVLAHSPPISTSRGVVVACSTVPTTPPYARTRQQARSMDSCASFPPRSPTSTLFNSPRFSMDSGRDSDCFCARPLYAIGEGAIMDGDLHAEPAGMEMASPVEVKRKEVKRKPIKPISPSERPRYDRGIEIKLDKKQGSFEPLGTFDVYKDEDVQTWKHYVQPEGQPYYLFKSDTQRFTYLTEAYMKDSATFAEVEAFMNIMEERAECFEWSREVSKNIEVVLEIQGDNWTYYMVDLDRRCVFWLDEHDLSPDIGDNYGVELREQFRYQIIFEYWQHIEGFPSHREPCLKDFKEVMSIINFWRIDILTSADSTAPYEGRDFDSLIVSVRHFQSLVEEGCNYSFAIASIARIMGMVANERFLNFYGFHGARLSVWQSVRGAHPEKPLWLVKYLSPLLFYAPETHLKGLEKLWVDNVIRDRRWKKYQLKLERDWESFVLTSTVLLNANVALLSTPLVLSDNLGNGLLWSSPAAVASQVSIIASLGSIIVGLLLIRQIRISAKDVEITASDTIGYLQNRKHKQLGLETLAIQYSLPYALLMWGMITFLSSIAISCFYNVDGTPTTLSKLIYAVAWFCVIVLILWTVLTGWETTSKMHWTDLFSANKWKDAIWTQWQWERPSKRPWTWRVSRKPQKDLEAKEEGLGSDATTVADNENETPEQSATPMERNDRRRWHVRVRNFGPVRRLTFNSFTRS